MWNIASIKEKKKYAYERIKNSSDPDELEKLKLSYISYITMLSNSGTVRYTKFYNIMDKITNNRFSLIKDKSLITTEKELLLNNENDINLDYLSYLLELCNNVANSNLNEIKNNNNVNTNTNEDSLISFSDAFYKQLGDKEIYDIAHSLLSDKEYINFSSVVRTGMDDCKGLTINDFIFNKPYFNVFVENNIFDYQAFNHEIMHGIDFCMQPKLLSNNYYGFHEVPTYTIDYLYIDYLDTIGVDKNQIQFLKEKKDDYLYRLAVLTKSQIHWSITRNKGLMKAMRPTIQDVKDSVNHQIVSSLLEIESGVIAYGLYKQISDNKDYGIDNLKKIMKNTISKDKNPDFSYINLDNDSLLELSKEIGNYSKLKQVEEKII